MKQTEEKIEILDIVIELLNKIKEDERESRHTDFTEEELKILKEVIEQQKNMIDVQREKVNDTITNRSVNVYKKQYQEFSKWCKEHKITQHDALFIAIDWLMKKSR